MLAIAKGLERILGETRFKSFKNSKVGPIKPYDASVDAFSLNTFSYYVAFVFEKLLAGMSWKKHLFTRGIALVTNTSTARVYENIRTRTFKALNIDETTPVKNSKGQVSGNIGQFRSVNLNTVTQIKAVGKVFRIVGDPCYGNV